jgi:hypothetical protein
MSAQILIEVTANIAEIVRMCVSLMLRQEVLGPIGNATPAGVNYRR